MKYSYNWLKELSGTKKSPEKAVEGLTFHSFEVESLEKVGNDSFIEIKVLPDRAHDCLSYVGVAREMAVLEGKKLDYDFDGLKITNKLANSKRMKANKSELNIKIEDKKLCPRYIGAVMTGIEIKDSPDWMKKRLEASGLRSINNVVDATNYVMLELGQPLHAFDFFKIKSEIPISNPARRDQFPSKSQISNSKNQTVSIVVRRAENGEKIELLDGVTKELTAGDLLITDGDNPLAIAGIKGGKLAEIDENTKTVVLESANFDAVNIRKTRMRLGLKTDSSDRFEKDIDPNLTEKAMARLVEIIEHIAGGKLQEIRDNYPEPAKPWKIKLDSTYANKLLGEFILVKDMVKILDLLGIKTKEGKIIECVVPTYRVDLKTQEDLIEEIGRIWGYEKVKEQPIISQIVPAKPNEQVFFERKIQDILVGFGFDEVYNYSFYSQSDAEKCGLDGIKHLELANPMNPDQKYVRSTLVPEILKNIHENLKYFKNIKIFEEGRAYVTNNNKTEEKRLLAMALVLDQDKKAETFFSLKGAVEDLFEKLGIEKYEFLKVEKNPPKLCHPERGVEIKSGETRLGLFGEINPQVLAEYKIKNRVAIVEFDLETLQKTASGRKIYKPLGKYPTVTRDISMLASEDITVSEITDVIKKAGGNLVLSVELFDVFQKNGQSSLAFHIEFGLKDKTLESAEVDEIIGKIISELEKKFQVKIRK